jgi:hypothetical protein
VNADEEFGGSDAEFLLKTEREGEEGRKQVRDETLI